MAKAPPSSLHWKLTIQPSSEASLLRKKLAEVLLTKSRGPETICVSGALLSSMTLNLLGGSMLPALSVAK